MTSGKAARFLPTRFCCCRVARFHLVLMASAERQKTSGVALIHGTPEHPIQAYDDHLLCSNLCAGVKHSVWKHRFTILKMKGHPTMLLKIKDDPKMPMGISQDITKNKET